MGQCYFPAARAEKTSEVAGPPRKTISHMAKFPAPLAYPRRAVEGPLGQRFRQFLVPSAHLSVTRAGSCHEATSDGCFK
jgi:hypothetical protein